MAVSKEHPLILCYDGSEGARYAIEHAGELLSGADALVLSVWQPAAALGSFAWSGSMGATVDFAALDRAATELNGRILEEGVCIAGEAGLEAEPLAVQSTGAVWQTIVEVAKSHDAAAIVMGSRGLTGLRSTLMGSVSGAVVHHANRPVLVVPHPSTAKSTVI